MRTPAALHCSRLPIPQLRLQRCPIENVPPQALLVHLEQFQFGHVQPRAMPGRELYLQQARDPVRLCSREGRVQRTGSMHVEIVQHQHGPLGTGEVDIHQLPHHWGPVHAGSPVGDRHVAPAQE